jgi:hypothetical protein
MSGIRSITRAPSIKGFATEGSAPIYVDSDDNKLKFIPAGSGTTEIEIGTGQAGLTAPTGFDLTLATTSDNKQVELNSRSFTQASGDSIATHVAPSQTVTTTGTVYGAQITPRLQDGIAAAGLVAVQGAPVTKGASAGTISGDVRAFEASIDLNDVDGTRTISGTVSALYAFLQAPAGGTYTGGCAVIHVTLENTHKWDFLLKADANNGFVVVGAGTYSTADGYFLVRVGASTYRVPFFTAVD